jgi:large subunit ribosomal protein L54
VDVPDPVENVDRSRVCVGLNYFQTGEDPPIREDSEYPDWLGSIIEPVKSYKELSPDTKQYWRRFNKVKAKQRNFASKQRR